MNFMKISRWDTANGVGIGIVLWVSGCTHHCEGCHNMTTWDASVGQPFTEETLQELLKELSNPHVSRITFSGGDPLAPYNRAVIFHVAQQIKEHYPDKKVWCYTGFKWDEIKDLAIMEYVDVLVDGRFILDQKDISLRWCGSKNQRVIDVQKTLSTNMLTLLNTED